MAHVPDINMDHLARLARIELTPEEKATFAVQLGGILEHIEQLKELDVSGIEPMAHAVPVTNVWRDDIATPGLSTEAALQNAPAQRHNMISVPKVLE